MLRDELSTLEAGQISPQIAKTRAMNLLPTSTSHMSTLDAQVEHARSYQVQREEAHIAPFSTVSPSILDSLRHLDLTGHVDTQNMIVASLGAYEDISRGTLETEERGTVNVAIKRLRISLPEDLKLVSVFTLLL